MTSKERIALALKHQEADRIPISDTIWGTTILRWRQEGLPDDKGPWDYFGYGGWIAIGADISLQLPSETIEDTESDLQSAGSGDLNSLSKSSAKWRKTTSLQMYM